MTPDLLSLNTWGLAVFFAAVLVTAVLPGPSVAALTARVMTHGWRRALPFSLAMWTGEVIWVTLAFAGLTAVASRFETAFVWIKFAGIAYLLYLAWQMWTATVEPAESASDTTARHSARDDAGTFLSGLAVTLGNPKLVVFYGALLPTFIDLTAASFADYLKMAAAALAAIMLVDCSYMALATRARKFLTTTRSIQISNRISAAVMAGAAAAIARNT